MSAAHPPAKQTAIVGLDDGNIGLRRDAPVPLPQQQLADDMILVRNVAVALSSMDAKLVATTTTITPGAIAGMDFAGEVVALGSNVRTAAPIRVGDRVCGAVPGMHAPSSPEMVGAFAEYTVAADITTMKIPGYMSFEAGASLGSGLGAVGMALFQSLDVPGTPKRPAEKPVDVLVYGGSTANGTLAMQLLKLSGLRVIATCSPHNFALVRSYGADAVFDYRAPLCTDDIRNYTHNSLRFALDCISEPETMQFCYACIGRQGGKYTALEPYPEFLHTRPNAAVVPDWVPGPAVFGKRLGWPEPSFARVPSDEQRAFVIEWFAIAQELLDGGKLKPHPLRLLPGGLDGVLHGLEQLRLKRVSGEKLVCRVQASLHENMDRILAEEPTPSGQKRYLVRYTGPEGASSSSSSSSKWVEVDKLQEKPQILHDWYKEKWWTT
ncbi:hypothetical protein JDV02_004483 [Purpureocillium takamizusanense]|uniref:Enoyl reductase (ER) domain-containing protein n=1 Tax=Purpureocillium takamizusanense TaxID=2060973 RepID=A0A9Q8VAV0_9HYPO|nr:uncharacterized protein JDV02_004483 [Purpureocillium takamizusanense]UNI18201.1 hypothetical protein JDV02_004483 [Purpureocillium takamizusanense]